MRPPAALTIAGSDPSGGAGIQADLKTFTALGVYGTTAITALTSQNTQGVRGFAAMEPATVSSQLLSVLDDVPLDATKIGMLASTGIIAELSAVIRERRDQLGTIVLDPVMVATSGDLLLAEDACDTLREQLLPLSHVVTPNLPEAARLLDEQPAADVEAMQDQAQRLRDLGVPVVLLKGGHREGDEVVDVIAHPGGVDLLRAQRVHTRATHGTGCTLSAAIAAQYARRATARGGAGRGEGPLAETLDAATAPDGAHEDVSVISAGRDFLQRALQRGATQQLSHTPETGHGPVDHLFTIHRRDAEAWDQD